LRYAPSIAPGTDNLAGPGSARGYGPTARASLPWSSRSVLHERPKLDRYRHHLLLACYAVHLDAVSGELAMSEIAASCAGWCCRCAKW
jgi:hypothetical protein